MHSDELLWSEKFRPQTVDDCVLPDRIKEKFKSFIKDDYIPNLLLTGGPGVGKTTIAKAILDECGYDWIIINGSMDGNIDTLRVKIKQFASSLSLTGKRKYVILDEADYLNAQSTQPALRNFMEEYSKNCGFIFTCNFKNRIVEPLHSRLAIIHFQLENGEKKQMAKQFMKRVKYILDTQGIKYQDNIIAEMIKTFFPDFRRVINELQSAAANSDGEITTESLISLDDVNFKKLIDILKDKNFNDMRKWVGNNSDIDSTTLYRRLYDTSSAHAKKESIPQLVLILGKYLFQDAFVADREVNTVACLTEILLDCEFK